MKEWLKKVTGVADIEAAARAAETKRIQEEKSLELLVEKKQMLEEETEIAKNEMLLSKMSDKERATAKGEPYVAVLDTKVNPDNIRNGFFELDWNKMFIEELIVNGYGTESDPEEEVVDRWFRDIVYQMLEEEGMDTSRGAGFINVNKLPGGKSAVS
jgi:hypothetical protein